MYFSVEGLFGTWFDDTLRGDANNNTLEGREGADILDGRVGSDTASYQNATAGLTVDLANPASNTADAVGDSYLSIEGLLGSAFNDTLRGDNNDNLMDGSAGADTMIGRLGNDTYFVDNAGDLVTENASEGNDLINASVNYTISANAEALVLIEGAGALAGLGNSAGNYLQGNSDNNALDGGAGGDLMVGGAGNDIYVVDNIGDAIVENFNEGNEIVHASIDYTIGNNIESLILDGSTVNGAGNGTGNAVIGNRAHNIIDRRGRVDFIVGGTGNDIYFVDNAGDAIVENVGEGNDIVHAPIGYTIGANIKSLILVGTTVNGAGNGTGNAIIGDSADNIIDGRAGSDYMVGGTGNDIYFVDFAGDSVVKLGRGQRHRPRHHRLYGSVPTSSP